MNPDFKMAEMFLNRFNPNPNAIFTFQTFSDKKGGSSNLNRVFHGTFNQHRDDLARLNRLGAGIFVMINEGDGIIKSGAKTCRTNANVIKVRCLAVDLDGAPLQPVLDAEDPPDFIIETSPSRWHGYWLVMNCPLASFKSAQISLAEKFGGDPSVNDLARVMRLPGFFHQKNEPIMTKIRSMKGDKT